MSSEITRGYCLDTFVLDRNAKISSNLLSRSHVKIFREIFPGEGLFFLNAGDDGGRFWCLDHAHGWCLG